MNKKFLNLFVFMFFISTAHAVSTPSQFLSQVQRIGPAMACSKNALSCFNRKEIRAFCLVTMQKSYRKSSCYHEAKRNLHNDLHNKNQSLFFLMNIIKNHQNTQIMHNQYTKYKKFGHDLCIFLQKNGGFFSMSDQKILQNSCAHV